MSIVLPPNSRLMTKFRVVYRANFIFYRCLLFARRRSKTVRISKSEDDSVGIKICGGNKIGIFVSDIVPDSPASNSNLAVGDRLINVSMLLNSFYQTTVLVI